MVRWCLAAAALAALAGPVLAQEGRARKGSFVIIEGPVAPAAREVRLYRLEGRDTDNVLYVDRPVTMPEAVVSRELSEQPVYTHLAEVKVAQTTIFVDPDQTLTDRDGRGSRGFADSHSLVKAQMMFKSLNRVQEPGVQVIPSLRDWLGLRARVPTAGTHPILLRPDYLERRPRPSPGEMPSIPNQPESGDRRMARSQ